MLSYYQTEIVGEIEARWLVYVFKQRLIEYGYSYGQYFNDWVNEWVNKCVCVYVCVCVCVCVCVREREKFEIWIFNCISATGPNTS